MVSRGWHIMLLHLNPECASASTRISELLDCTLTWVQQHGTHTLGIPLQSKGQHSAEGFPLPGCTSASTEGGTPTEVPRSALANCASSWDVWQHHMHTPGIPLQGDSWNMWDRAPEALGALANGLPHLQTCAPHWGGAAW